MYKTSRLDLKTINEVDASEILEYYRVNRDFLKAFEPMREEDFFTLAIQEDSYQFERALYEDRRSLKLFIYLRGQGPIIGILNFSQIVMNAFCSCYIGYSLSVGHEGYGYMTEAVKEGLRIIFEDYDLHRVEGNVMPCNDRSIKILEKLGFRKEGLSRRYLKINGQWEDHIHYALLNEKENS